MKNVLIVGAGSAGKHVLEEITENGDKYDYNIIGFLDADFEKHGSKIKDYKVLGHHDNINKYVQKYNIDEVIVATTEIKSKGLNKIYDSIKILDKKVEIKVLPTVEELLKREPFTKQLREVQVEDLLGRESVQINDNNINKYLNSKKILVTGAAGSIGSELCRQIVKYNPKELIILDINENDLYFLKLFLERHYDVKITFEISNIREKDKLKFLFELHKPDIVFHAAAHKHVPLMEKNIEEAIKNNVFGTKNILELSDKFLVDKFVLISTDKAVNPTNVMGATKRLSEIILEKINNKSETKFMAVRFGNVLGSNGSVIPLFKSLIKEGRDLTVTHKEVTRFFMTIPEAAQLVLEAGFIGEGGEVFVLDMGKPIKIMDLAKKLIELSGLTLGKDIDIKITGLRPGEKLFEEILYDIDSCEKTINDKIYITKLKKENIDLEKGLLDLKKYLKSFEREKLKLKLKELVKTYKERKDKNEETNNETETKYPTVSS
ncbi:NDP-sugar epimerase, includes UDP-GlcNAc-inverting 4,6-dehydratase FlaA1 and capsular polysaccharide biosynthesis protein EpsC [Halanaerobium congolense]|jgi:FlaA1/EpsC-like NDP-sugar epimerase|uniref:NDP-sugar epimerase, includes UDP-GlcNAc-inverting 4,6-dehydratase FlaA1 and capsular polysaccharide biosynthesis protein EpsC n=1 Tax=Halanaerobium congolense TaxID=54121 RepID=A0A1H9ZQ80_9FIRM|nr:nucleoside-diphosphate sugar epimerase/dehydratase [Halanaerobium congolense]PTX16334.1 FlaA1/EpsC-like NDP-sugar epimerase [Halanaerobium congolense]SDF15036.1 NDP-sugar epimerase, includes UDP-GlcNAc-inverting 4,6-dehydratase FlaA1 and capsular polysaccharide biosynthesis protein EpsC [Halanaerobium congolense]SES83853.1 NDP-sugar epimerase, includes UDP-GlcNAc-inverting 4,6-dehydratase FlaA1 and capsular polysaccharide biosynthesis protein EpsC [Halanaerobium congolense]SFP44616.1 NDP-sug